MSNTQDWTEYYESYSWEELNEEYKKLLLSSEADKEERIAAVIRRKSEIGQEEDSFTKRLIANAEHLSQRQRFGG